VTTAGLAAPDDPELKRKVAFLTGLPGVRSVIETHMAYVFLTDRLVYKLKKPIRVALSDCRTLAARQRACDAEVRLNQDLAGGVYLGAKPLVLGAHGLGIDGEGEIVDWLVKMRRLPADRMLDAMIGAGAGPTSDQILALSACLIGFYRRQAATPPSPGIYLAHLQREQRTNADHLTELAGHLPDPAAVGIAAEVTRRLESAAGEITARDASGLVVEGHGDLRPEHVCLTSPPVIFDRVESALELRVIDIYDEAMYLAFECALLGHAGMARAFAAALQRAGVVPPSAGLLRTYLLVRMLTRARLSLDHLRDPDPRTPEKWPLRAQDYLDAAASLLAADKASGGPKREAPQPVDPVPAPFAPELPEPQEPQPGLPGPELPEPGMPELSYDPPEEAGSLAG